MQAPGIFQAVMNRITRKTVDKGRFGLFPSYREGFPDALQCPDKIDHSSSAVDYLAVWMKLFALTIGPGFTNPRLDAPLKHDALRSCGVPFYVLSASLKP